MMKLIMTILAGGFTGYITNDYAIKLLFKEYWKLGGIIKKTKDEFINNVSQLVEADIINHKSLSEALQKEQFRQAIEKVTKHLLNEALEEHFKDIKFSDLKSFDPSVRKIKIFVHKQVKSHMFEAIETICQGVAVNDLVTPYTSKKVISNIFDNTMLVLENTDILSGAIASFLDQNKDLKISKFVNKGIKNQFLRQLKTIANQSIEEIRAKNSDAILSSLEEIISEINIEKMLKNLENTIGKKKLKALMTSKNQEKVVSELVGRLIDLLESEAGKNHILNFLTELIRLLKQVDKSLLELIPLKFRDEIEAYIQFNIPYAIHHITSWVDKNKDKLEGVIEDAVDFSLEGQVGIRGLILNLLRTTLLKNVAKKNGVVSKIIDYMENEIDIKELSEALTDKTMAFIKDQEISTIVEKLDHDNHINKVKLTDFLVKNLIAQLKVFEFAKFDPYFNQPIDHYFKLDFLSFYEKFMKKRWVCLVNDQVIHNAALWERGIENLSKWVNSAIETELGAFITEDKKEFVAKKISDQLIDQVGDHKEVIENFIIETMEGYIGQKNFGDLLKAQGKTHVSKGVLAFLDQALENVIDEHKSDLIRLEINKLNKKFDLDLMLSDVVLKYLNENLQALLAGRIEKLVRDNLGKLDEDEVSELVENFMGSQLKPISYLGGALGLLVGLFTWLLNGNLQVNAYLFGLLTMVIFAVLGYATNKIALRMLFKPYEKIKCLSKFTLTTWFSQGFILRNKPKFADEMSKFIDQDLLAKASIHKKIQDNKAEIKDVFMKYLSDDDYSSLRLTVNDKIDAFSKSATAYMLKYFRENASEITAMLGKGLDNNLSGLDAEEALRIIMTSIVNGEDKLIHLINDGLKAFANSSKTFESLVSADMASRLENRLTKKVSLLMDAFKSNLKNKDFIKRKLVAYEGHFSELIAKSMTAIISDQELATINLTMGKWIEGELLKARNQRQLNDFINLQFEREFSPDTKVKELFDGKLKNMVVSNFPKMVKSLKDMIQDALCENKDALADEVKSTLSKSLNGLQKFTYKTLGGDGLVDTLMNRLVDVNIPDFVEASSQDLEGMVMNVLNEKVFETKLSAFQFKANRQRVQVFIIEFLEDEKNLSIISSNIAKLGEVVVKTTLDLPLKETLELAGIKKLDDLVTLFSKEIQVTSDLLADELTSKDGHLSSKVAGEIYKIGREKVKDLKINAVFKNISDVDLRSVSKNIGQFALKSDVVMQLIEKLLSSVFKEKYKDTPLHEIVDQEDLLASLEKIIVNLSNTSAIRHLLENKIQEMTLQASNDFKVVVERRTMDHILEILMHATTYTLQENLNEILDTIDFKAIVKREVNAMQGKEIHDLFYSFAGNYFKRLERYGLLGFIFGIPLVGNLLLVIGSGLLFKDWAEKRN